MKKTKITRNDWEVPELPPNAVLRPPRRRPPANARMPQRKITLPLDIDLIAWFKAEAERDGLNHVDHINKALRQYIIDLVGDKPTSSTVGKRRRHEAGKLIDDTLVQRGLAQQMAL